MNDGKIIVMEGACDGIGKTTQYSMLYEHLKSENINVYNHHFPTYHTYQGMPVEKYLSGEYGSQNDLSPYFVTSLYALDRAITWNTIIKPLYESGSTILLDRYTTSSLIYQAAIINNLEERKKFIDYVIDFEYNKIGIKEPDQVIFLYAPFELITSIRNKRKLNDGILNDIHESDIAFMKKVYENSTFVADYLGWDQINCNDGNSMRIIKEIHNDIYKLVKKK